MNFINLYPRLGIFQLSVCFVYVVYDNYVIVDYGYAKLSK